MPGKLLIVDNCSSWWGWGWPSSAFRLKADLHDSTQVDWIAEILSTTTVTVELESILLTGSPLGLVEHLTRLDLQRWAYSRVRSTVTLGQSRLTTPRGEMGRGKERVNQCTVLGLGQHKARAVVTHPSGQSTGQKLLCRGVSNIPFEAVWTFRLLPLILSNVSTTILMLLFW